MSTTSRGTRQRRDLKTSSIILLQLLIVINCAKAIDYAAYRTDVIPPGITRDSARTTRGLLEELNHRKISESPNLQDGTEHLLHYGALLRAQILDTFGRLVYEKYDDFSMPEIEALYRIYRETLERRYNIFDIVPKILEDPDTRPTKICSHINRNVQTCLKEISHDCMNVRIHDDPHHDTLSKPALNVTKKIYLLAEIPKNYPEGFSLNAVLDHLRQRGRRTHLRITPGLFSGLLHNIRYDNFDDGVRTAEREIVSFLANKTEDFPSIIGEFADNTRSVSQLLKNYLTNEEFFYGKVARHAAYLAEHVLREVDAVDENIELLGTIYENSTINLGYLFELVLPNDTVDRDIAEARDYLLHEIREKNIVEKYLRVEKYQQARPDQLIMEIFGQLRDIEFAVDIVTSLHAHASFWHRSHMIENLNDLLDLFEAYENFRGLPNFSRLIEAADQIKNNLQDSKNVTVELLCTRPRACLRIGLELVFKCATVNDETKIAIKSFLEQTACDCSLFENSRIIDESRISDKPGGDIGIKISTEAPQEIVGNETKNPNVFDKNQTNEEPPYDIETNNTAKTPQKIGIETNDSSSRSDKKIPLNYPTLMDHVTETFETWTNIYDFDYEDNYSNSDDMGESVEKNGGKILQDNNEDKSSEQSCVGEDCLSSKCNGTECIEHAIECTGDNCTVDCSGDDCLQPENCTGSHQCTGVKSKNNCTGDDCSWNTDEVRRDCEGSNCVKNSTEIDCEGADCSAINCEDGNCNGSHGSFKCEGDNCRNSSTAEISCEGSDCTDASEKIPRLSVDKIQCQGSNCSATDCTGDDCKANTTLVACIGPDCPDSLIAQNCTGLDCPRINCTGENCLIKETTIECEGTDCSKNVTTCTGKDCSMSKNEICVGPNCTSEQKVKSCEGDNCFVDKYPGDDCKGSNCSDSSSMESDCDGDSCEDYYMTIKCDGPNCTENSMEICDGADCDYSENKKDCADGDCTDEENENDCTGSNCSINKKQIKIDCKGDNCIKEKEEIESCSGKDCPSDGKPSKNTTNILVPSLVTGEVEIESCTGKNCSTNVESPTREKEESENSTDPSFPSLVAKEVETESCPGKNCPTNVETPSKEKEGLKNSTDPLLPSYVEGEVEIETCIGKNCPNSGEKLIREKERSVNSTIPSYADTEIEIESCPGKNCPINVETLIREKLPTENSTNSSVPSLVEQEIETESCSGKNCSININTTENSTNSSVPSSPSPTILVANRTIFCDNGDLYYRRKLNRLRKMRRIFGNSSRNRAKVGDAISASSNFVSEKTETNEKNEFNNFRRSQQNNSEILRTLLSARANNTVSRSHGHQISYEKLRTTQEQETGNNVHNKSTVEKNGNLASEEDSNFRIKKIRKKLRKHHSRTGGRGKERFGVKTTIVQDKDGNEDNKEIGTKRREDEARAKQMREKLRKIRGGRYRIKTTLVKDDDYEDDEGKESSDDLSLEEILTQRVREEMKKLQKNFRTNSTELQRGKRFRVTGKLSDRDSEDSRDSGSKDFSIYREKPIRKKRISSLTNENREAFRHSDVERVPIVRQTDNSSDYRKQKYIFRVPRRIRKPKYRPREFIDKHNDFNEVEKNITSTS